MLAFLGGGKGIILESPVLSAGSILGPASCVDHRWRMKKTLSLHQSGKG